MILLLSCKNGTSQSNTKPQRMYTEAELQEAVRKAKEQEKSDNDAIQVALTAGRMARELEKQKENPKIYYVFGIIHASYSSHTIPPQIDYYSYSTKIIEYSHKPTRDDEYRILDDLDRSDQISIDRKVHYDFKTLKRKVFVFDSYADASEKQQFVYKYGLE